MSAPPAEDGHAIAEARGLADALASALSAITDQVIGIAYDRDGRVAALNQFIERWSSLQGAMRYFARGVAAEDPRELIRQITADLRLAMPAPEPAEATQ